MSNEPSVIYLDVNPPTAWGKNSKRSFKGRVVTAQSIQDTKSLLVGLLLPHKPSSPMRGAVKMHVMVCWPYKKTEKKSVVESRSLIPKITKPDGDNVLATIKDVMESLQFFNNDSQVYCEHIERWHGPSGFIRIEVMEVAK